MKKIKKLKLSKIISYQLFVLLFTIVTSCSSLTGVKYDRIYPLHSTCILKNGLWGDWKNTYSFKTYTEYSRNGLNVYIYYGDHPSDYAIKIFIDKTTRSENGFGLFSSYDGEITVSENNTINYGVINDNGKSKCRILCDKKMDKSINKNGLVGTLNVMYNNGTGRGFTFFNNNY